MSETNFGEKDSASQPTADYHKPHVACPCPYCQGVCPTCGRPYGNYPQYPYHPYYHNYPYLSSPTYTHTSQTTTYGPHECDTINVERKGDGDDKLPQEVV